MTRTPPQSCSELLLAMVGFDTVNHHISGRTAPEQQLALYLEEVATAMGFVTSHLAIDGVSFNLLVMHIVDGTRPWLLFESHLDTVSVEGMSIDPFGGEIRDGRLYGRGACDTKGTGASMLWALHEYAADTERPNNVAIAYTTDEEIRKTGINALVHKQLPTFDWWPSAAVVGEPTRLRPVVAHNGIVRWSIRTHGVASHSCDPSQGKSAISMMVKVIDAIETRYVPVLTAAHPLTGKAQCSINQIQGGAQINIIAETCEIRLDRRVVPGEDPQQVIPAIERLLDELRSVHPDLVVEQDSPYSDPPLEPAGGEAFAVVVQSVLSSLGLPAEPDGAPYSTDASQFGVAGIAAVVLGPGDIAQAHTHDEWIPLEQLHRAVEVYRGLMRRPLPAGS